VKMANVCSAPKGDVIGPQKRKLAPEEDEPSAKRPVFWAWDCLQVDKMKSLILGVRSLAHIDKMTSSQLFDVFDSVSAF